MEYSFEDFSDASKQTNISIFTDVEDTSPKDMPLEFWLLNTINPQDEDLKAKVLKYRNTFDKSIKTSLPCATISASFDKKRSLDNIKKKNKLICIDVDRHTKSKKRKCNECVDMTLVKEMFAMHPCTYYCGLSVGGDGIYAIIRIEDENQLGKYFKMFEESLARIGINIDVSCKDYTRLRFYSYDPNAYFNPDALYYKAPKELVKKEVKTQNGYGLSDVEKVEKVISLIEEANMDITCNYDHWIKVGAALYEGFGDSGIDYFHRVSSNYPDYDAKETNKKWESCRRMNKIKLSAFFWVANEYGIRY